MKGFPSLSCSAIPLLLVLFLVPPLLADWEPDVRLTYNPAYSYTSNNNAWNIAASSNGSIHVVWRDERGGPRQIYYKRSLDNGITWSSDTCISSQPDTCKFSSIAVADTMVHLVWDGYYGWNYEIYYRRSANSGLSWGPIVRLTDAWNESCNPSMAVLDTMVHVVWQDYRNYFWRIFYKHSTDDGATWSPDTALSGFQYESSSPSVCVSGSDVHAVWYETYQIYYARSTDNGNTWSTETRLSDGDYNSSAASIACSGPNVHIVWTSYRTGKNEIYYKHSSDRGITWSPDTAITAPDGYDSKIPSIAVSDSNLHVVWVDIRGNGSYPDIYYKKSTNSGQSWLQDTRLTLPSFAAEPSVAVSGLGVHVLWEDARDPPYTMEIYYKRNPTGKSRSSGETNVALRDHKPELKVQPNPFVSSAFIPGHEREDFTLYDISGRLVGSCLGSRVGALVPPGVYFLRPKKEDLKPIRIVKVR